MDDRWLSWATALQGFPLECLLGTWVSRDAWTGWFQKIVVTSSTKPGVLIATTGLHGQRLEIFNVDGQVYCGSCVLLAQWTTPESVYWDQAGQVVHWLRVAPGNNEEEHLGTFAAAKQPWAREIELATVPQQEPVVESPSVVSSLAGEKVLTEKELLQVVVEALRGFEAQVEVSQLGVILNWRQLHKPQHGALIQFLSDRPACFDVVRVTKKKLKKKQPEPDQWLVSLAANAASTSTEEWEEEVMDKGMQWHKAAGRRRILTTLHVYGPMTIESLRHAATWDEKQGVLITFVEKHPQLVVIDRDTCPDLAMVGLRDFTAEELVQVVVAYLQCFKGPIGVSALQEILEWKRLHQRQHGKLADFLSDQPVYFDMSTKKTQLFVSLAGTEKKRWFVPLASTSSKAEERSPAGMHVFRFGDLYKAIHKAEPSSPATSTDGMQHLEGVSSDTDDFCEATPTESHDAPLEAGNPPKATASESHDAPLETGKPPAAPAPQLPHFGLDTPPRKKGLNKIQPKMD